MAWCEYSAEAVVLHGEITRLNKQGRVGEAVEAIKAALVRAHMIGPSGITMEEFGTTCDFDTVAEQQGAFRELVALKDKEKGAG